VKKKFKCRVCGEVSEFETDGAIVELREAANVSPGRTYIVECKSCGAQNRVTIREDTE